MSITSEGRQGPQTATYKLDGSVSTNPGRGGMEMKSTAKWDGSTLVIETTSQDQSGNPVTTTVKRRLDNGGKSLIQETTTGGANPMTRKVVYDKS